MQKPTLPVVIFVSSLLAFAIIPTIYAIMVVSESASAANTLAETNATHVAWQSHTIQH